MKSRLFTLLLFLSIFDAYSSDVKFCNINAMYGISMREIASVCKDENGFIWASSKTGILRVTESDYHIYQLPYKTANVINVKLAYKKSLLIAYTNNGQFFRYNELYDRFDLLIDLRVSFNNSFLIIGKVVIDDKQTIWIPCSEGLCKYQNGIFTKINKKQTYLQSIIPYDKSHMFVTHNNSIILLNTNTLEQRKIYKFNKSFQINTLFYDKKKDVLWIGTSTNGLYYLDMREKKLLAFPNFPKQPIGVITESLDSTLLIGIDGQGIWELDKSRKKVLNTFKEDIDNPFSLCGDGVYDIFCDEKQKVWVATYSGGLSFFDKKTPAINKITHLVNNTNSLGNNNVNKILEDSKGDIWFATNNGISRWRVATNKWDTYYQNKKEEAKVFLALCEDNEGNIWAGSFSSGFYVLNRNTGTERAHYPRNSSELKSNGKFIMDIYKDSEGDIWIGGFQDVICYFAKEKRFHTYGEQPVRSFMEFSPGKMLLACSYCVILLDKKTERINYLAGCLAQSIIVRGNNIWIATSGDGLLYCNYKTRNTNKTTVESGLPSNHVNSVMYDNKYLWLGTENGLCKYNPIDKSVCTYYSYLALSSASFNINASCKLRSGELIWGTNNGAIIFDPNKLGHTHLKGYIYLQNINISGSSIRENQDLLRGIPVNRQTAISFRNDKNTMSVEIIPIGLSSTEIKFSWKMEGLDSEWSTPSNSRIITYTNMLNGNFKLRIRMYDNSLSQIIDERALDVHVIPLYWQTWWFRLTVLIIITSIIFFVLKFYIDRLKRYHAEDKIRFFTNTAHDLRTSITLINAPIQELNKEKELSEKGHYYLNLATEQSEHLSNVTTQLLNFQKVDMGKGQLFLVMTDIVNLVYRRKIMFQSTAEKRNIILEFSSNIESYISAVDELKIEKVIDNLVSNAIKYSHANAQVDLILDCKKGFWSLEVKDNGMGISDSAQKKIFKEFYREENQINSRVVGSGIGLLLVKSYVMMHGGKIALNSKKDEGSTFRITIPYKEITNTKPIRRESLESETLNLENKKYILIVDDNKDLRNFLKCSFEGLYCVLEANNGMEAWELLQKESPELIISDVMMPGMDGFELCKLIKSTFKTSHIPIILLTALCERSHQLEGLGLGAEDYITKPFDISLLEQRIKSLVRNREIITEKVLNLVKQKNDIKQVILSNELNDTFVKKAVEVIYQNIQNFDFDKDSFAMEMNVSSSLLYKKIKALTDQSPSDFIKTIRLNHALELLQSRKYTITEISELCGYSSVSYFSTVFRKYFGKSPTEV